MYKSKLLLLVVAGMLFVAPAHACLLGMGNDCPISDSESAQLIKAKIESQTLGRFQLYQKITGITAVKDYEAAKNAVAERITWILSNKPCNEIPPLPFRRGESATGVACERGRFLAKSGLFIIAIHAHSVRSTQRFDITAYLTEEAAKQTEAFVVSYENNPSQPVIILATHTMRFVRVVRSRVVAAAGQNVTEVEFEYEQVPNVWARIEKKMSPQAAMPNVSATGVAYFQKWSDGWRMVKLRFRAR